MDLKHLTGLYQSDPRTRELLEALNTPNSRTVANGLVGSQLAFVANAVIHARKGTHLFIMNDKEDAAYFLNDLESVDAKNNAPLYFPDPGRSPYDEESSGHEGERVMRTEVLEALSKKRTTTVIVTYPEAIASLVVGQRTLEKESLKFSTGSKLPMDIALEWLQEQGFTHEDLVFEPGQFSIRGGIIDIFSYGNDRPYRIELLGDTIESVRLFDPQDQLSTTKVRFASIVPDLHVGHENELQPFLDQLPKEAVIWWRSLDTLKAGLEKELKHAQDLYDRLKEKEGYAKPSTLFTSIHDFEKGIPEFHGITTRSEHQTTTELNFDGRPQPAFNKNFTMLSEALHRYKDDGFSNIIACSNEKQVERLFTIFEDMEHEVCFTPMLLRLQEGFIDRDLKITCFTDHQIFERYNRFRLKEGFRKNGQALTLRELTQLKPGDLVVHVDHGIGTFSGLEKLEVDGRQQEAIRILYQGDDILYVSIHSLHRVSKYSGKEGAQPKVSKLGSKAWKTLKERTKSRVKEVAFDLIKLYAQRKAQPGHEFPPDNYLQHELEASFIYEDTPDQEKATVDVKEDMQKAMPMDRLICGDVGFGKTEIAIRAAFKAVCDSKQVAMMVPTTILSYQHYKTFQERLKDLPCRVDYINRFRSTKEQKQVLKDLEEGKIDILIGTHRLVSKDVKFKALGLMILDEEQKFGVSVKDKLKTLRATVDTLTLTATPIPRTLQFSMMGARDLSIISTPPPNRYPVETHVKPFNEELIRAAIEYEVGRGGQVFFVHNKVRNISEVAEMIKRLCPGVSVTIGHGQMDGKQLEKVMLEFIEGDKDVLVATTIVESGLDIPNANTMIINEAQNFGLSDLHQLRGRVGRSNKKAFCYLLAPPMHALSADSKRRLLAIEQFSDLGSGLHIAMRDLDIRGAGDLLGAEQSGFINDIGMETYQRILDEAVQELKENEFKELFKDDKKHLAAKDCLIETDLELLIPSDYVSATPERLALYRELDEQKDHESIDAFRERLVDRFGPVPAQTETLLQTMHLRFHARELGIERLILKNNKLVLHFMADQEASYYSSEIFSQILEFIKSAPEGFKMYEKNGSLRMSVKQVKDVSGATEALERLTAVTA